jgi:UDP-galactopyranose mutase
VYSGKIDEFFDYRYGELDYRSLRFETVELTGDFQGASIVNYAAADVPYTRIVEHKHFALQQCERTVITYEHPQKYERGREPFYPIRDWRNTAVYERYRLLSQSTGVIFGGRLGTYQYFDMHQVVGQAMVAAKRELGGPSLALRAA